MRFDFTVLGATGMQGRIVSRDLLEKGYSVLLCGRDRSKILHLLKNYKKTAFEYVDVRDIKRTTEVIKKSKASMAINCVEGEWNIDILRACIKAGVNSIDLGSDIEMTKKQLKLDGILKKKNLIHITGCGSVPGIGNVMLRYAAKKFDRINTVEAGFAWDSNIKKFVVPFSIQSIIEELTEPAQILKKGKIIRIMPLETMRESYHSEIGKQRCFIAHHPETYTFYHYFRDKGIQNIRFYAGFPQHSIEKIMALIELGLGSKEEIEYNGMKIKPVNFLAQVLKRLKFLKNYREKENLWVRIHGKKNGKGRDIIMECLVCSLKGWEDAGCNVDTGMPASIIAQMIKKDIITERGSFAPEGVVSPQLLFKELKGKKMIVRENGKIIN